MVLVELRLTLQSRAFGRLMRREIPAWEGLVLPGLPVLAPRRTEIRLLEHEGLVIHFQIASFLLETNEPFHGSVGVRSDVAVPHGDVHDFLLKVSHQETLRANNTPQERR